MGKRLTQEEFEKRIEEQGDGEYTPLEEYQGSKTPILMKHNNCGKEWKIRPENFMMGQRCPRCSKSLTQKVFEKRIQCQGNGEYLNLEKYKGAKTPVLIIHKVCGHQWKISPSNFFSGKRCPKCAGNLKKDTASYVKEVEYLDKNYKVVGEYKNNQEKVKMFHIECGNTFDIAPANFSQGNRCPVCFGMTKKDTISYTKEVEELTKDYKVLGEYKNSFNKIKMLHIECGNYFKMNPHDFLRGRRCPHCRQSYGETSVANFLKNNSIEYEFQKRFKDCKDKRALPFDFYIPALNSCIEFDGIQHFEPIDYFGGEKAFKEVRRRDGIKTKYCKEKGIKLLRIRYDEDVEEKLNSILKKSKA